MSAILGYGADSGIPTPAVVPGPGALASILDAVLSPPVRGVQDLQVRILRTHPGKRCVFEIRWRGASGAQSCIGKVYGADRADVYRAMEAIRAAGFGSDAEFSIPDPVAYVPEYRLLLQERVAGRPATDRFLSSDHDERVRMSDRCGAWLARFHTVAPRSGPTLDLAWYQISIEKWARRIASVGGALADKAAALHQRLALAGSSVRDIGRCPCHGSFTHHQVITAPGRTVTIDWDDHAVADPAFDVARFVIGLRRLALRCLGSIRALDRAADAFLDAYAARRGRECRETVPLYAGAICLRLAKKDVRRQAAGWSAKAEGTLDEGLRVLEQGRLGYG